VKCNCSAGILPAVPRASRPRLGPAPEGLSCREILLRPPGRGVLACVGVALAGVDGEAEDGVYFYRLVAAEDRAEFPTG